MMDATNQSSRSLYEKAVICQKCGSVYPEGTDACRKCSGAVRSIGSLAGASADAIWLITLGVLFLVFLLLLFLSESNSLVIVLALVGSALLVASMFLWSVIKRANQQKFIRAAMADTGMAAFQAERVELYRRMKQALDGGDGPNYLRLADRAREYMAEPAFALLALYHRSQSEGFFAVAGDMMRFLPMLSTKDQLADGLATVNRLIAKDSPVQALAFLPYMDLLASGPYANIVMFMADGCLGLPTADVRIYRAASACSPEVKYKRKLYELLSQGNASPQEIVNLGRILWDSTNSDETFVRTLARAINISGQPQDSFTKTVLDRYYSL